MLRRSVDYCLVTEYKKKRRKESRSVRARAWVNERTRAMHAYRACRIDVPRGTCERNAPELQKGLAPHKGNDMCRSINRSVQSIDRCGPFCRGPSSLLNV